MKRSQKETSTPGLREWQKNAQPSLHARTKLKGRAVIVTNRVKCRAGHMPGTKLWQLKAFFTSHSLSLSPCSWSFYCSQHPHPQPPPPPPSFCLSCGWSVSLSQSVSKTVQCSANEALWGERRAAKCRCWVDYIHQTMQRQADSTP